MSISSLTAALSLAVQTDKTTAASYNFVTGLLTRSQLGTPQWDVIEPGAEHPGAADRNTVKRSTSERFSYMIPVSTTGLLYPRFMGMLLRGVGMDVTTTDNTGTSGDYSHAFTIAEPDDLAYLTALWEVGVDAANFERMSTGVRLTQVQMNATPQSIEVSAEGVGLTDGASAGTETKTSELATKLIPTLGTFTMEIGGVAFTTDKIRQATVTIDQGLDTEDYALWTSGRFDLPQDTINVTGSIGGIDLSYDAYKKINWGGTGGSSPDYDAVTTSTLTLKWQSANNISGGSVPHSIEIDVANAEVTMTPIEASGEDKIRYNVDWVMIDDETTPLTITLVNDHDSYAYESS